MGKWVLGSAIGLGLAMGVVAGQVSQELGVPVSGFVVDTSQRRQLVLLYNQVYQASEGYASEMGWTGSISPIVAGTTTDVFKNDVLRRLNMYRAIAGLPADIALDAVKSTKCQDAALMMSLNKTVNHSPPSSWTGYTAAGAEAAGLSNLSLGVYGPEAINYYMMDDGTGNEAVGHRQWLLYTRLQYIGTGDVLGSGTTYLPANATWVASTFKPSAPRQFVAWPSAGYFPISLLPNRWSIAYPGANFDQAVVTMKKDGASIPTTVISRNVSYADKTLVWTSSGVSGHLSGDCTYEVTITGMAGTNVPASVTYTVTMTDAKGLREPIEIVGSASAHTTGQDYRFQPVADADGYELEVSSLVANAPVEGAEDSSSAYVVSNSSAGYSVRQTGYKRSGSKAFQLTFPSNVYANQSFDLIRDICVSSSSQLKFYERAGYSTTNTTLEVLISADSGSSWTRVYTRNGIGSKTESTWSERTVSLSEYAGKCVTIRYLMESNGGSVLQGVTSSYGFFIDDVSVTNSQYLVHRNVVSVGAGASGFVFDATAAKESLVAGAMYGLRMRAHIQDTWYGYEAMKSVTVTAVATLPVIDLQPSSVVIAAGQSVTLEVGVTGVGVMSYQWYQGGAGDMTRPVGSNSYRFVSPLLSERVSYWVRVINAAGSVDSQVATVGVTWTYASWASGYETANQLSSGALLAHPNEDYDGDGVCNLLEFAFGSSPVVKEGVLVTPRIQANESQFVMEYRRDTSRVGTSVVVEVSTQLSVWYEAGQVGAPVVVSDELVTVENGVEMRRVSVPKQGQTQVFMRIRARIDP